MPDRPGAPIKENCLMSSRIGSSLSFRLLGLVVALVVSFFAVQPSQASFAFCANNRVTTYYSDASHSTVVGRCAGSCCDGCTCTGTTSAYSTSYTFECLDVVCPQTS
jgi:hypothetical protein